MSGFRLASRDRLVLELCRAIQAGDVQLVHSIVADNHGDAADVDLAFKQAGGRADRQALLADYRSWASEMGDDDVADEVPSVLLALAQPSLWGTDW